MEAQDWCRKYMRSGNVKDLTQAWDLYYHVFRRISKQLPQVSQSTEGGRERAGPVPAHHSAGISVACGHHNQFH